MKRRRNPVLYIGSKLAVFLVSIFVLSLVVFYISRLAPGDPLVAYYGDRTEKMSPEELEGKLRCGQYICVEKPVYAGTTNMM